MGRANTAYTNDQFFKELDVVLTGETTAVIKRLTTHISFRFRIYTLVYLEIHQELLNSKSFVITQLM